MIAPTEETEHNNERKNAMQNEELEIIRMSEIQMREVEWLWYTGTVMSTMERSYG